MSRRSSGIGYTGSEKQSVIYPTRQALTTARPAVIFCHGAGGDAHQFDTYDRELYAFADAGFVVGSFDGGGTTIWNNATAVTRLGQFWTWLKANFACHATEVILWGTSMGFTLASKWGRDNEANVRALGGLVPACDMNDIHDNDRGGLQAGIRTAFTDLAGWNAAKAARDPVDNAAAHTFPVRLWYSTSDTVCLPAAVTEFDTGAPDCTLTSLGAVGHDSTTLDHGQAMAWLSEFA